nr:hypothetical protein [Tanacetum cinerariifolium]
MDVKTAFLNGDLNEVVYVSQPDGFVDPEIFKGCGRSNSLHQERKTGKHYLLVQIYVDIIFASTDPKSCDLFAHEMNSTFKMSMMGQMFFFLGLQISQNPRGIFICQAKYALEFLKKHGFDTNTPVDTPMSERPDLDLDEDIGGKMVDPTRYRGMVGCLIGIFICQAKYALEILKKHGFDTSTPIDTPMLERPDLDEDIGGKMVDPTRYRGMVGCLMYLTATRPDIVFAVCMCARYQAKPTEKHLHAIKRIFRYLKGTLNMGLWYPKDSGFALTTFADADYAGCQDTRRSTSGFA